MWNIVRQTIVSEVRLEEDGKFLIGEMQPTDKVIASCSSYSEAFRVLDGMGVREPSNHPYHTKDDRRWLMNPSRIGEFYTIEFKYDRSNIVTAVQKEK